MLVSAATAASSQSLSRKTNFYWPISQWSLLKLFCIINAISSICEAKCVCKQKAASKCKEKSHHYLEPDWALGQSNCNFKLISKIQSNSAYGRQDIIEMGGRETGERPKSNILFLQFDTIHKCMIDKQICSCSCVVKLFSFSIIYGPHGDIDRFRDGSWSALDIYWCH